jgi:hypothetical protein
MADVCVLAIFLAENSCSCHVQKGGQHTAVICSIVHVVWLESMDYLYSGCTEGCTMLLGLLSDYFSGWFKKRECQSCMYVYVCSLE